MDRVAVRKEIEILFFAGHKRSDIKKILDRRYSSNAPCLRTVQKWIERVKCGDTELKDAPRSGRPLIVTCDKSIDRVQKAIQENPKFSLRALSGHLELSKDTVKKILIEYLGLKKLNARWVPFTLSESQKQTRIRSCKSIISIWDENWPELVDRIVTSDETWICYENADNRKSAAEWRKIGSNRPEIPKLRRDTRKIMATIF